MSDTVCMNIETDFSTIPDRYAKQAPKEFTIDGTPILSFPFTVNDVSEGALYLHWMFVDPDSIPVCGFQWNHWAVANVPIASLKSRKDHAVTVPEDFSRHAELIAPEAMQARNSEASPLLGAKNPKITTGYVGPTPPDRDHEYLLTVWASTEPFRKLSQDFWFNELQREIRNAPKPLEHADIYLTGRA